MRNRSARRGKGNVPSGNKASLLAILHRYQRMSSELEKLQSEVTNIVSGVSLAGQTVTGPFCNRKIQYSDFTAATFVDADFTGSEFDRCRFDETDWWQMSVLRRDCFHRSHSWLRCRSHSNRV